MRELSHEEIEQVSGGVWWFLVGYAGGKALDGYFAYAKSPEPLFTDTQATLKYGNASGMY